MAIDIRVLTNNIIVRMLLDECRLKVAPTYLTGMPSLPRIRKKVSDRRTNTKEIYCDLLLIDSAKLYYNFFFLKSPG